MKNKKSIKRRILRSTLTLVIIILLGVFLAFNILVNSYIDKNANKELKAGMNIVENYDYEELYERKPSLENIPNLTKIEVRENISNYTLKNKQVFEKDMKHLIKQVGDKSKVQAMIINEDNELLFPTEEEYYVYDISYLEDIADAVKKNMETLKEISSEKVSTSNKSYYYSILKLDKTYNNKSCYILLFVDINEQLELAQNINTLLFIVMCIAGILTIFTTLFLSEKISKPIKKVSEFAKQIGDGDFTRSNMGFEDKELDELLKVMNKSAEYLDKYDKEQKIFFQNISHELRTPLMSMMGYAEAIKYNVMEKEKACNIILEEGDKLKDMIEELLYISRMDSISEELHLLNLDLREILSSCIESKQATAVNTSIELICDFDEKPVMYICDEKSLRRAFLNIIENGLRYAKSKMYITCKFINKDIVIVIENDGENINNKDMPYIFERFYKGDKGKSGIGLSIVKSIIEKHKGNIYCENTNKGVRFTIIFYNLNML